MLTDNEGEQSASGTYTMTYYKAGDSVGTYSSTATTAGNFVVDKYYKIASAGNTSFTGIGAANNNVGTIFKATGVGSGTGTAYQESVPWILGTEFEVILYATCQAASIYLGDVEMEAKFTELTQRKIDALNQKEIRASMKGSAFSAQFSTPLL